MTAPGRDARVSNLALGADDALGHGAGGREKRVRDLFGGEAAHLAQGQCDLRIGRQRRMAAREDQPQPIVLDSFVIPVAPT